jgi:branched-chain amino acid transport system ATP-binding protein
VSTTLLDVAGLRVRFGKVVVLDGVDFRVDEGEIVALLGTNGAGKSTLLRTISGLWRPFAGTVTYGAESIAGLAPHRIVRRGLVQMPGGRATFPGLSVEENLRVGAACVAKDGRQQRVDEVLALFPWLEERRSQLAGTLSGGQQQMLALGRALIARPRLIMIDELSLGLAPTIVAELLTVIAGLREQGTSIVVVEQHVDLALSVADRAYFLERGQVRFEGPAADLHGRTDLLRAVFFAGATA